MNPNNCYHPPGKCCISPDCLCDDLCANDECGCGCHKKKVKKGGPYPWCRDVEGCNKLGYCSRNPSCGD